MASWQLYFPNYVNKLRNLKCAARKTKNIQITKTKICYP